MKTITAIGLAFLFSAFGIPTFAQAWDDIAKHEASISEEYEQNAAQMLKDLQAKQEEINADPIKGYETEAEYTARKNKAMEEYSSQKLTILAKWKSEFAVALRNLGNVYVDQDHVKLDVGVIDPETKTFPIVASIDAGGVSFKLPITYSIKAAPDIRTSYYSFADAARVGGIGAEFTFFVESISKGSSYNLHLVSWRLFQKDSNTDFVKNIYKDAPIVAWCATIPPKVIETSGRIAVSTKEKVQAQVFVDDKPMGTTPLKLADLAPGKHLFTFKWSGGLLDSKYTIQIAYGDNSSLVAAPTAPPNTTLSSAETAKLKALLVNYFQTSTQKLGDISILSVQRVGSSITIDGKVLLNILGADGRVATTTWVPFKQSW